MNYFKRILLFYIIFNQAFLVLFSAAYWARRLDRYYNLFNVCIVRNVLVIFLILSIITISYYLVSRRFRAEGRVPVHIIVLVVFSFSFFMPYIPVSYMLWYPKKIISLQEEEVTTDRFVKGEYLEDGSIEYEIFDEGAIRFKDGDWVFIVTRAMEKDQIKMRDCIDFSLAVDSKGNVYSLSHRVGNLIIKSKTKGMISNIDRFLELNEWVLEKHGKGGRDHLVYPKTNLLGKIERKVTV